MKIRIILLLWLILFSFSSQLLAACPSGIQVARAELADKILQREPQGHLTEDSNPMIYFTEILNGKGQTIRHRWFYQDKLVAEIPLSIGGNRWRTWSRKLLGIRSRSGWKVETLDAENCLLDNRPVVFSGEHTETPPNLSERFQQIMQVLDTGDLLGAELALKNLSENSGLPSSEKSLLDYLLRVKIPLMRISQQLESGETYLARERLDQTEKAFHETSGLPKTEQEETRQKLAQLSRMVSILKKQQDLQARTALEGLTRGLELEKTIRGHYPSTTDDMKRFLASRQPDFNSLWQIVDWNTTSHPPVLQLEYQPSGDIFSLSLP